MDDVTSLGKKGLCWAIAFLSVVISCRNPHAEQSGSGIDKPNAISKSDVMESAPAKKLLQYWDNFNFSSSALATNRDAAEQKLVDFIASFPTASDTVVQVAVWKMLDKTAKDSTVLNYFVKKYQHYLYDPNSPMRDEGSYEKVLSYLVEADATSPEDRMKYTTLLELVRKNQVGTVATDFEYLAKDGKYRNMHAGTNPYKMLVFYDPTCTHCAAMMQDLAQTPAVHNCIENGFLEIVSVSLHPDKEGWVGYQKRIPDNWINGWDEKNAVINDGLYNITAYPTIFLLDQENKVLLKDAPLDVTLRYLVNLVSRPNGRI